MWAWAGLGAGWGGGCVCCLLPSLSILFTRCIFLHSPPCFAHPETANKHECVFATLILFTLPMSKSALLWVWWRHQQLCRQCKAVSGSITTVDYHWTSFDYPPDLPLGCIITTCQCNRLWNVKSAGFCWRSGEKAIPRLVRLTTSSQFTNRDKKVIRECSSFLPIFAPGLALPEIEVTH